MNESGEASAVRAEVRAWLEEFWDPERPLLEWRGLLADSGWGCPSWPRRWFGRDLAPEFSSVVDDEFKRVGAVGVAAVGVGILLAAPTLLEHASDDLTSRLLRAIVTSEERWCELFSEPGCGSDLAALTTRADRDCGEWVVNGQKVWTTGAQHAAYALLLARTNWDVPKHRGITCFAFPMRQRGVDVRPLRQMNNHATFNEVFLTDARVSDANVIGEVGSGWPVALTTLGHERRLANILNIAPDSMPRNGRTASEAAEEASEFLETYRWYPQRGGRPDLVQLQARSAGSRPDPVMRQRVAALTAFESVTRWNAERSRANQARDGKPGPQASLGKLSGSQIARQSAGILASMAGPAAMLSGPDSPFEGAVAETIVSVPAASIAGGTDEIQRNIIGERVLALPREPAVDIGVPFKEVRNNERAP